VHRDAAAEVPTKVPAVTFGFWIIKILATILGETTPTPRKAGWTAI
jgi:uncharacterized membrane-anchored protein